MTRCTGQVGQEIVTEELAKPLVDEKQPNATQTEAVIPGGVYQETTNSDETVLNEKKKPHLRVDKRRTLQPSLTTVNQALLSRNLGPDDRPKLLHTSYLPTVVLKVSYLSAVLLISLGVQVQPFNSSS